jgi:hypothetical protein
LPGSVAFVQAGIRVIELQQADSAGSTPADVQHLLYYQSHKAQVRAVLGKKRTQSSMAQALPLLRVAGNSVAVYREVLLSDPTAVAVGVRSSGTRIANGSGSGGGAGGAGTAGTEPQQQQLVVPDGVWVQIGVEASAGLGVPAAATGEISAAPAAPPETSAAGVWTFEESGVAEEAGSTALELLPCNAPAGLCQIPIVATSNQQHLPPPAAAAAATPLASQAHLVEVEDIPGYGPVGKVQQLLPVIEAQLQQVAHVPTLMGIKQLLQCEGVVFMLFPGLHLQAEALSDGVSMKKFRGLAKVRSTLQDGFDAACL